MASNSVITLTTGVPGAGKTYVRASRFLVDDFLINTNGMHISNFPLNVDLIAETVEKKLNRGGCFGRLFGIKRHKITVEDIKQRLEIIPDVVLQAWKYERSGPWEYFRGRDLRYCHIAIDEIHNFVSDAKSIEYLQMWDDWLGEVRHMGCTFEGLTQDISQVDQILVGRASIRLEIVPGETLRDPLFKICMGDWYELKAGITGEYHKTVFEIEKRKTDRRFVTNNTRRFLIVPEYYKYYNSYSASLSEKADGVDAFDRAPLCEYQKRGKIGLLFWFVRRNFFTLFWRLSFTGFLIWLFFFGGLLFLINCFMGTLGVIGKSNSGNLKKENQKVELKKLEQGKEIYLPGNRVKVVSPVAMTSEEKAKFLEEKKIERLRLEEEKRKRIEEEQKRLEQGYRIVFLTSDFVVFANGSRYKKGEKIYDESAKKYHGMRIKAINFSSRSVDLDGIITLRM